MHSGFALRIARMSRSYFDISPRADLEGCNVRHPGELGQQLGGVAGLGPSWIDMDDQVEVDSIGDGRKVIADMFRAHPESQPEVRWHHQQAACPRSGSHVCMLDALVDRLAADSGDDGNNVPDLASDDTGDPRPLGGAQREHFTRMAIRNQAADSDVARKPSRKAAELFDIDRVVSAEWDLHRGQDSAKRRYTSHDSIVVCGRRPGQGALSWGRAERHLASGSDCGVGGRVVARSVRPSPLDWMPANDAG